MPLCVIISIFLKWLLVTENKLQCISYSAKDVIDYSIMALLRDTSRWKMSKPTFFIIGLHYSPNYPLSKVENSITKKTYLNFCNQSETEARLYYSAYNIKSIFPISFSREVPVQLNMRYLLTNFYSSNCKL